MDVVGRVFTNDLEDWRTIPGQVIPKYLKNCTLYKPHAEWITAARNREKNLSQRNARLIEKYNRTAHTLRPLLKGQIVSIQCTNNNRWNTTGQIIETLPHNQYRIRVDGSGRITLRNRRFLRKLRTPVTPHPILSPSYGTPILERDDESKTPALQTTDSENAPQPPLPPNSTNQPTVTTQAKPARALSRLLPHNKPGLKELIPPERPLLIGGGGRYRTSMNSTHLQANSNMAGSLKS